MKDEFRFGDLIDFCMNVETDPEAGGNIEAMFRRMLSDYFFKDRTSESKGFAKYLAAFEVPPFLEGLLSLMDVDIEELKTYIEGESTNTSLAGRIMLSQVYLKSFYPDQPPGFTHMHKDVRDEIFRDIKQMNQDILRAFEKMKKDIAADRSRSLLMVVAAILKRVHVRSGFPLNRLDARAEDVIRRIYPDCDEVFKASGRQLAELRDDKKTKDILKAFFQIKKFQDLSDMAAMFGEEFERLKARALRASR